MAAFAYCDDVFLFPAARGMVRGRVFLIGVVVAMLASSASAEVFFSDATVEISGSGPRASRNCTVALKPTQSLGGDLAPQLVLMTSGQSRLSYGLNKSSQYAGAVIVQNNVRRPFANGDNLSGEQFRYSDLSKALKSQPLFFITAQQAGTTRYVSSRYQGIDLETILTRIETHCLFDAESMLSDVSSRQKAEQALSIPASDLTLIRWVLVKRYGGSSTKPDQAYSLAPLERSYLKQYTSDNGLPISQYLTADTASRLAAEGQQIAKAALPSPVPSTPIVASPWPASPAGLKENFWSHNSSRVQLKSETDKPGRTFVYETPSPELQRAGVSSGTVLFRGSRTRNNYTGTAFAFSPSCAAAPYEVTGTVSEDQRSVTLQGMAPVRDLGCKITSRHSETLTLVFHDVQDNWGEPR